MNLSVGVAIWCVLVVALPLPETTHGNDIRLPNWLLSRHRRISDQRLAEIETLLALEKVKGVAVPVGLGKVDPAIIGRKRRSIIPEGDPAHPQSHRSSINPDTDSAPGRFFARLVPLLRKDDPRQKRSNYQLI